MTHEFIDYMRTAAQSQLFAGGAALGLIGGLMAWGRNLPATLWRHFLSTFSVTLRIENSDPIFEWMQEWFDTQPYTKRSRRLAVNTVNGSTKREIVYSPAPGRHYIWYSHQLLIVDREQSKGQSSSVPDAENFSGGALRLRESFSLRMFGRSQKTLRKLVTEVMSSNHDRIHQPKLYLSEGEWWTPRTLPRRPIDTVILPEGVIEDLIEDMTIFTNSGDWYQGLGVPYRRGYLFEGPPGTGKSSVVVALARHLKKSVYVCSLSDAGMSDQNLLSLIGSVKEGSIVLFEDVDAVVIDREKTTGKGKKPEKGVSLSGLLNAIDGVIAPEARILIMTTNYPDKLDAALVRAGRIDRRVSFPNATANQIERMFLRFFPGCVLQARKFAEELADEGLSPAQLQEHFLSYRESAHQALSHVGSINKRIHLEKVEVA